MDWAKTTERRYTRSIYVLGFGAAYSRCLTVIVRTERALRAKNTKHVNTLISLLGHMPYWRRCFRNLINKDYCILNHALLHIVLYVIVSSDIGGLVELQECNRSDPRCRLAVDTTSLIWNVPKNIIFENNFRQEFRVWRFIHVINTPFY